MICKSCVPYPRSTSLSLKLLICPYPEHVKSKGKKNAVAPDYSKLLQETGYEQRILGNIMFNGKLIQASANFSCFMTMNTDNPAYRDIPEAYRVGKASKDRFKMSMSFILREKAEF